MDKSQTLKSALRLYKRIRKGYLLCPTLFTIGDVLDYRYLYFKLLKQHEVQRV